MLNGGVAGVAAAAAAVAPLVGDGEWAATAAATTPTATTPTATTPITEVDTAVAVVAIDISGDKDQLSIVERQ